MRGELSLPLVHELRDIGRAIVGPEVRLSNPVELQAPMMHELIWAIDEVSVSIELRLKFFETAQRTVRQKYAANFHKALEFALRTAK